MEPQDHRSKSFLFAERYFFFFFLAKSDEKGKSTDR